MDASYPRLFPFAKIIDRQLKSDPIKQLSVQIPFLLYSYTPGVDFMLLADIYSFSKKSCLSYNF